MCNRYSIRTRLRDRLNTFDRTTIRGIFVSESFIKEQKLEDIVAGSEMTLTYYVPIGIYESHIDKEGTYYKSDGDLYVKEEQTFKILWDRKRGVSV